MKKIIAVLVLAVFLLGCVAGCTQEEQVNKTDAFVDNGDGTMTYLDTQTSPFEGGLKITIDKNENFVNFQITDDKGNETVEFYKFTTADSTCHRYKYVSAMGTGFNYYYDYKAGELYKIEDKDNADTTQSTKESGRFERAQRETKEQVNKLMDYFLNTFDSSIEDIVK